jgi:metal-responsive CopG/Arc/MetJ family transcriptional regulator
MCAQDSQFVQVMISLPADLLRFADYQVERLGISRSQVISEALKQAKLVEEERLAMEGYLFYALEAKEFSKAVLGTAAEAINDVDKRGEQAKNLWLPS